MLKLLAEDRGETNPVIPEIKSKRKTQEDYKENAQVQIKAETANARREINKALSAEQLTIKRDWTKKQNELKEKLFAEVKIQLV